MKLVIIYGPPAAGKLTVSKELAKLTGFEIFHNHVTYDIYRQVMPVKNADFWKRVNDLRFELIELAAANDINLIFTLCYESDDFEFIQEIKKRVQKHQGQIYYVHLIPSQEVLYSRVVAASRKEYRKLDNPEELKTALKEKEYYQSIDEPDSLVIDNTDLGPEAAARQILAQFKL